MAPSGIVVGQLSVSSITEGVHSGDASGVIPDSFRIARQLLSRIEDPNTGEILVPEVNCPIPDQRLAQTKLAASILKTKIYKDFPFREGAQPTRKDEMYELALNRTWRPTLTVTGASGLPSLAQAGNVLRPNTTLNLSIRIPPNVDPKVAQAAVRANLRKPSTLLGTGFRELVRFTLPRPM